MPRPNIENFSLDKEQLDSLRLEFQNFSPKDREKMKTLINECDSAVMADFKNYFPEKETAEEIPARERFLMTDQRTFERFDEKWLENLQAGDASYTGKKDKGNMRTFLERGDFAAGFIPDIWKKIPNDMRKKLADIAGGKKQAEEAIHAIAAHYVITHELLHLHQDKNLPLWLSEAGAYYYTQEIMKKNKWGALDSAYDNAADFYRELLEKYGDDVHKIYFDKLQDKEKQEKIFSEFTDEKRETLFPDYREEEK